MGIFLQDAILEPFGAEVFGLNQKATAAFQQAWGGGALLGMLGIGILSSLLPIAKKTIATLGGLGVAGGLALIALAAATSRQGLITPGLGLMGLGIGLFNVGALSMMMEMTVAGQAGLYMGLWGMAQGLGNGLANIVSGGLHTGLIESGLLSATAAYAAIFGVEALLMVLAIGILRGVSVQEFKGLSRTDIGAVLAMDTAG
jgi:BCD family chlorophyll transporter-like MFS transporter